LLIPNFKIILFEKFFLSRKKTFFRLNLFISKQKEKSLSEKFSRRYSQTSFISFSNGKSRFNLHFKAG